VVGKASASRCSQIICQMRSRRHVICGPNPPSLNMLYVRMTNTNLTQPIDQSIKRNVIDQFLAVASRDHLAKYNGIVSSTVTNILNEYRFLISTTNQETWISEMETDQRRK
jgi:hypothetical protein